MIERPAATSETARIGATIVIPLIVLVAVVIVVLVVLRRRMRRGTTEVLDERAPSGVRLTTHALRQLGQPPWRVVHEIASDALEGIDCLVVGPPGVFAITTSLLTTPADAARLSAKSVRDHSVTSAFVRSYVEALAGPRLAAATVHVMAVWGANATDIAHGSRPVDGVALVAGTHLVQWLDDLDGDLLAPAAVDLAWSQVCVGIGRPDPLA